MPAKRKSPSKPAKSAPTRVSDRSLKPVTGGSKSQASTVEKKYNDTTKGMADNLRG